MLNYIKSAMYRDVVHPVLFQGCPSTSNKEYKSGVPGPVANVNKQSAEDLMVTVCWDPPLQVQRTAAG